METQLIGVDTSGRQIADLTGAVVSFSDGRGDGLVHVFAPHATAGIALMELGSGSEADLIAAVEHLFPRDDRYRHRHGSTGHGADHVLPVFVSPSLVLPVFDGTVQLGTWQSVVLVDTNGENPHRTVRLSFVAG
ncbi:MAG: YjbQ family protein [Acidimicrobiales bacterium]